MKKALYFCIILAICIGIVSCGKGYEIPEGKVAIAAVENIGEYKVVRAENASETEKNSAVALHQAIYKVIDSVKITTDYNSASKEILVGNTKRPESAEAAEGLLYHDYVIKKSGQKIVVVGGSDEALEKAVETFIKHFIDAESKSVKIPISEDGYIYKENYTMNKLTIENIDIFEFQLYNKSLMSNDEILPKLRKAFGLDITIETDKMTDGVHYIILDGSELIADKYSIKIENGNIIIRGSARSLPIAVDEFTGSYLDALGSKEYNLTAADNLDASTGKKEIYTKEQLMTVLTQIYNDPEKIIIGEESSNSKVNCITSKLNGFYNATGEYPGIIGIDLACYGVDLLHKTDAEWSAIICEIIDYCADGGIITISAHWDNPSGNIGTSARCRGRLGYDESLEGYEKAFADLITEGTEYNAVFKNELTENARFLKALGDNGVPVIWRPLHEANGGWFWFGTIQKSHTLDSKYIVGVWHYVHDYFTKELGLTNLIWNYSPNYSTNINDVPGDTMSTTYLYPGDEYCDMVGCDWYSNGNLEITKEDNYLRLIDLARKPGAINEFGPNGSILADEISNQPELYNSMDLYEDLCSLAEKGCSFAYLLTWGDKWGIPAMGKGDEFMAQAMTLGQADVKAIFDSLK